ncbi:MAG: hypothetical protein WCC90_23700 [Methylocella sp.]
MNNRFGLSPNFRIEREQKAMNIETVTARIYNIIPGRAAFIAAILAGARPEYSMPVVSTLTDRTSRTPGPPPCGEV